MKLSIFLYPPVIILISAHRKRKGDEGTFLDPVFYIQFRYAASVKNNSNENCLHTHTHCLDHMLVC